MCHSSGTTSSLDCITWCRYNQWWFLLSEKYRHDVVGMLLSFVFDAKVVNYNAESYGAPFLCEHTMGVIALMVD